MVRPPARTLWRKQFAARTKRAREDADLTQEQVSTALGVKQDTYKNYETKRPMPHELIEAFCIVCSTDVEFLFPQARRRAKAG